jgi:hypothetical protein
MRAPRQQKREVSSLQKNEKPSSQKLSLQEPDKDRARAHPLLENSTDNASQTSKTIKATLSPSTVLVEHAAAYRDVCQKALTPNPYYAPRLLKGIQTLMGGSRSFHLLTLAQERIQDLARNEALTGYLPFRAKGRLFGYKRIHKALVSPYVMETTPLITKPYAQESMRALVTGFKTHGKGLWSFPMLPLDSDVGILLKEQSLAQGYRWYVISQFQRAILKTHGSYEAYSLQNISKNRRKSLKRYRQKLNALGALSYHTYQREEEFDEAFSLFIALEKKGWKGRRGTAMGSHPDTIAFGKACFTTGKNGPKVRVDMLRLNGQPLAISMAMVEGGTVYLAKTTYDENYASYAPGLLLEEDITRTFLNEPFAQRLDSASLAGCVLEELWCDRSTIGDVLIVTDPTLSEGSIQRLIRIEHWRQSLRSRIKAGLHTWLNWRERLVIQS